MDENVHIKMGVHKFILLAHLKCCTKLIYDKVGCEGRTAVPLTHHRVLCVIPFEVHQSHFIFITVPFPYTTVILSTRLSPWSRHRILPLQQLRSATNYNYSPHPEYEARQKYISV